MRLLAIMAAILAAGKPSAVVIYPLTTTVVEVNRADDYVVCSDYNGNLWSFHGSEDWEVDDICSLLMSNNSTENIYDDVILCARYNG